MKKIKTEEGTIFTTNVDNRIKDCNRPWTIQDALDNCCPNGSLWHDGEHLDCVTFTDMTNPMWFRAKKPVTLNPKEIPINRYDTVLKAYFDKRGYTLPAGVIMNFHSGPIHDCISVVMEGGMYGYEIPYGGMNAMKDILRQGEWEMVDMDEVRPWEVQGFHGSEDYYIGMRAYKDEK